MQVRRFTLIELTVVLVIILLITGIVTGRLNQVPRAATLDKTVRELESFFAVAERAAAVRGKKVEVCYFPDRKKFAVAETAGAASGIWRENREFLTENYRSLYLNPHIQIRFDSGEGTEAAVFQCMPDGMTVGPKFSLSLDGKRVSLKFSSLTGRLRAEEELE